MGLEPVALTVLDKALAEWWNQLMGVPQKAVAPTWPTNHALPVTLLQ